MIRLAQNRYAFPLANIKAWCAAHGLEWTGSGVRPLPKAEPVASQASP
jgi:hypothetical protein